MSVNKQAEKDWKSIILFRFYYKEGQIFFRERPNEPSFAECNLGRPIGSNSSGYLYCTQEDSKLGKKGFAVHRIVWLLCTGEWPENTIDHINGNPLDNRFENLRDCTQKVNNSNKGAYQKRGRFKGVYKVGDKWEAVVSHNKVKYRLGKFHCIFQAVKAYDKACIELKGELARPNLPKNIYTLD